MALTKKQRRKVKQAKEIIAAQSSIAAFTTLGPGPVPLATIHPGIEALDLADVSAPGMSLRKFEVVSDAGDSYVGVPRFADGSTETDRARTKIRWGVVALYVTAAILIVWLLIRYVF